MAKRKAKKPVKPKVSRTTKKKSTTRRRKSGNPFEIDNVPTLI
jgi:hypothetical protein